MCQVGVDAGPALASTPSYTVCDNSITDTLSVGSVSDAPIIWCHLILKAGRE